MRVKESFSIIPAGSGVMWFFAIFSLLMLSLTGLFAYIVLGARAMRFEVTPTEFSLSGGMYGRRIPMQDINVEGAKAVDLDRDKDYQLAARTNGTGLPGFAGGWFRTHKGEKCLAFVTDRHSALYVPTRKGYCVLISVENPEALRAALVRAARGG